MMSYYTPYSALQDLLRHYNANKNETDKLPMIPYHGLRHTSATLLIAAHRMSVPCPTAWVMHRLLQP